MFIPTPINYFADFEQIKKLLLETHRDLRDNVTPLSTLFFYYHHVTYRTPCHAGGHLVTFTVSATDLRERFSLSGVFYFTLFSASFKASLGPAV